MAQIKDYASTRPPMCNLEKFAVWKTRIRIYMNSIDDELFNVTLTGPPKPYIRDSSGNLTQTPVPRSEWTDDEKKARAYDLKVMNILVSNPMSNLGFKNNDQASSTEVGSWVENV